MLVLSWPYEKVWQPPVGLDALLLMQLKFAAVFGAGHGYDPLGRP